MKEFVQCLVQNPHTRHCHTSVWICDPCQHTDSATVCLHPQQCLPGNWEPFSLETPLMGTQWDLNKQGNGFTERLFSDWFGAKICHEHLVLSRPPFPTLENKRERRKEREAGREGRYKINSSWIPSVPESNHRSSAISCVTYLVLHSILLRKVFYSTNKFANHRWMRWSTRHCRALRIFPNPVAGTSPAITPALNQRIPLLLILVGACCLSQMKLTEDSRYLTRVHRWLPEPAECRQRS